MTDVPKRHLASTRAPPAWAIVMFFLQRKGGRDAFWIFVAAYVVVPATW